MGKKLRDQATKLGLIDLPLTTLYARPKRILVKQRALTQYIPDVSNAIKDYIAWNDSTLLDDKKGKKNVNYYYLAPDINLYVEIFDKANFWTIMNPAKHALQINIYCKDEEIIRGIANAVNQLWDDGVLVHMDWQFIEKKFKINRDDCIAVWKQYL